MRTLISVSDRPFPKALRPSTLGVSHSRSAEASSRPGERLRPTSRSPQAAVMHSPPRSLVDELETDSVASEASANLQQQDQEEQQQEQQEQAQDLPDSPASELSVPSSRATSSAEETNSSSSTSTSTKLQQTQRRQQQQQESREPPSPSESKMETLASQGSSENSNVQQNNSSNNSINPHKAASGITFQPTASPDRRSNISAPLLCSAPNFGAAQTSENDDTNNDDDDDDDDFVDLSGLFQLLQQKNWAQVLEFLLKHPNASRQTIHCQGGVTFLLHIVLRHGPPAPVVDLVVSQDQGSAGKGSIWKQTDTKGRLPLHAACSCGPESYPEVITKVIRADPDALRMRTENADARLPLHLAVVTGASERVVQQLLIHYPYAAFVTDGHGKIALDYAEDSCYGHNRLVVALELAPMLLDTAQAAEHHCEAVRGGQLAALREAHAVSLEQLRARSERETRRLLDQQVRCNQDLADEKARNLVLARTLVEARESYRGLLRDRANLRQRLERERTVGKTRAQARDDELKRILLMGGRKTDGDGGEVEHATDDDDDEVVGTDESARADKGGAKGEGDHEGDSTKAETDDDDEDDDDDDDEEVLGKRTHSSLAKISLPVLLKRISSGYEASKRRNRSYKEQLDRQRETVKNLNLLLTAKEEELAKIQKTSRIHERTIAAADDRVDQLAVLHREAMSKFARARDAAEKWKRLNEENERDLDQALRRLKIQDKRVSGFRALLLSMGSGNEPAEPETSPYHERAESSSSIMNNKEAEVSVELQVGETAVADAPKEDQDDSGTSVADSREAALSVELAVASAIGNFGNVSDCGTIETLKADSPTPQIGIETPPPKPKPTATATEAAHPESNPSEAVTPTRKLTQEADKNDTKWIRGTPQTLSIRTVTTTGSYEEETDGQHAVKLFPPETPPVPGHVGGRRELLGGCSPLASPRLELP